MKKCVCGILLFFLIFNLCGCNKIKNNETLQNGKIKVVLHLPSHSVFNYPIYEMIEKSNSNKELYFYELQIEEDIQNNYLDIQNKNDSSRKIDLYFFTATQFMEVLKVSDKMNILGTFVNKYPGVISFDHNSTNINSNAIKGRRIIVNDTMKDLWLLLHILEINGISRNDVCFIDNKKNKEGELSDKMDFEALKLYIDRDDYRATQDKSLFLTDISGNIPYIIIAYKTTNIDDDKVELLRTYLERSVEEIYDDETVCSNRVIDKYLNSFSKKEINTFFENYKKNEIWPRSIRFDRLQFSGLHQMMLDANMESDWNINKKMQILK